MNDRVHFDILDNPIKEQDVVLTSERTELTVAVVYKLTPKMVQLRKLQSNSKIYRYPKDVFVISDNPKTSLYLIKNS